MASLRSSTSSSSRSSSRSSASSSPSLNEFKECKEPYFNKLLGPILIISYKLDLQIKKKCCQVINRISDLLLLNQINKISLDELEEKIKNLYKNDINQSILSSSLNISKCLTLINFDDQLLTSNDKKMINSCLPFYLIKSLLKKEMYHYLDEASIIAFWNEYLLKCILDKNQLFINASFDKPWIVYNDIIEYKYPKPSLPIPIQYKSKKHKKYILRNKLGNDVLID